MNKKLESLPEPIQAFLKYSLPLKQVLVDRVDISQEGIFKQDNSKKWIPFIASQSLLCNNPAFTWQAKLKPSPLWWFDVKDAYASGKGSINVKLYSLLNILESSDGPLHVSSLIRFLSETPWFPTALISNRFISWQKIDSYTATAKINHFGLNPSVTFSVNNEGQIVKATSDDRYMMVNKDFVKTPWSVIYHNYNEIDGMQIPTQGEARWQLPDGNEFCYIKIRLTQVKYSFEN